MRLFVLHYHLLPGGVTDVIRASLQAVLETRSDIDSVDLISGRAENLESVVSEVRSHAGAVPVRAHVWDELDYADPNESRAEADRRAAVLSRRLDETLSAATDLLWAHNYHLGKNAGLTSAIADISSAPGDRPRMLLHIHDFPEEGRPANLAYLHRCCGGVPYPINDHTNYLLINKRDHALLGRCGVPKELVHYLPNPVVVGRTEHEPDGRASARHDRLVMGLSSFAREAGHRFHPDGPIVLYPVRSIRRKNVLELAMICRLMPDWNLVVTLPGTSESEKAYSELIAYAYADRRIHGCFAIGKQEHRYGLTFDDLIAGSDLIASSSVQEGFGLAFLNTLLARVPLLARRVPTMAGLAPLFEAYPAHLYESFRIPLSSPSISSMRGYLRMRYGERLDELARAVPEEAERIEERIHAMIDSDAIDVSFLPAQLQLTLLGDIRDERFADDVRQLNTGVLEAAGNLIGARCPDISERISAEFGLNAFARRFSQVVDRRTDRGDKATPDARVADRMRDALTGVEQARLLLGPLDHD